MKKMIAGLMGIITALTLTFGITQGSKEIQVSNSQTVQYSHGNTGG
ncbi:hypothetical protein AB1284_25575 [Bacillus sp. S2(2024)]